MCVDESKGWRRWSRPAALVLMVLGVTVGHMAVPVTRQVSHDLLVRLYYLPIALGGAWFGLWGGLGTAGLVTLVYLPHILLVSHGPLTFGYLLEIPVFLGVGLLTGLIVDRQVQYRRGLEAQAETLARSHRDLQEQTRLLHGGIEREDQELAAPIDRRDRRARHRHFQALLRERTHEDSAAPADGLHTLDRVPCHAALQNFFHYFELGKFGHAGSEHLPAVLLVHCLNQRSHAGSRTHRMIQEVGSPHLGANWDPCNAYGTAETPYPDGYNAIRPSIFNVHVKDTRSGALIECVPVGEGAVDWEGQLSALVRDRPVEHITIETHCLPLVEKSRRNVTVLTRMLERLAAEERSAPHA